MATQSQLEIANKMTIAASGVNFLALANVFKIMEHRKQIALDFYNNRKVDDSEKYFELLELHNQQIKDLLGL